MADINKIIEANKRLTELRAGGISLDVLDETALSKITPDLEFREQLAKVAETQRLTEAVFGPGTGINLGAVSKIADCIKNIDDIIVEKIKAKALEKVNALIAEGGAKLGGNDKITKLMETVNKVQGMISLAERLYNKAKAVEDMSLVELLTVARESGVLDRVPYFNMIQQKYGAVVGNVNALLENLANLDICNLPNYGPNGQRIALPVSLNMSAPTALPNFAPPVNIDTNLINTKGAYADVLARMGDIANDRQGIELNGSNTIVLSELQTFGRTIVKSFAQSTDTANDEATRDRFTKEIDNFLSTRGNSLPQQSKELFRQRAMAMTYIAYKDAEIVRSHENLKQGMGTMANGQRVATGVTIYGGPDWDFTTFLDIKPQQRPADLISYWTGRGYNIADQERKLQNRGIKTGTLNYSDAYAGAYNGKLRAGYSCASTRFPGGSQLQLRNPDGTIFDPAGINPSGIVTVDDTGNVELTYKKVDLFISREHVPAYKKVNLNAIQISLVSLGTKHGKQYVRAQNKFGSSNIA